MPDDAAEAVYTDAAQPVEQEEDKEPKKAKRLTDEEMKTARERYERGISREEDNRDQAREDLQFKVGNQWDDAAVKMRGNRPTLTFNRMLSTVRQVTGDIRQNKPAIRVRPNGDGADKDTAEMFAGLIRNIEQQSHAGYVYAQAGEASTSCGFGYFRIVTEYATADSFTQDIRLKGIPNPLSVVCDPDAQELDRSDARWWFIYSKIPKEDFEKQYPDANAEDFEKLDKSSQSAYGDWYTSEGVRIAEYWEKVPVTKTLALLSDDRTICLEDYEEDKLAEMMAGASYASVEQRSLEFLILSLRPRLVRIEQALYRSLMTPSEREEFFTEFLVDGLLRGDIRSRYAAYSAGRQWGWLSINDVRAMENMNPIDGDGGNEYLRPLNMADVNAVDAMTALTEPKQGGNGNANA